MKVHIDPARCAGCGTCEDICPQVFAIKGKRAVVRLSSVPARLRHACRQAMALCPLDALRVDE